METVSNTVRQFLLIVCYHHQSLVLSEAELLDNLTDKTAIPIIEAMKRFIQNQQFRVFHKGSSQKAESLLSTTQLQERLVCDTIHAKDTHPIEASLLLLWLGAHVESNRIA